MAGGGEEVATAAAQSQAAQQQQEQQQRGGKMDGAATAAAVDQLLEQEEAAPDTGAGAVERIALDYQPTYQRFRAKEKSFTQQYSHMYTHRLRAMRPLLETAAKAKWGEEGAGAGAAAGSSLHYCPRIIDLVQEEEAAKDAKDGKKVVLVGTLFKDMPLRPSVLDEYRGDAMLQGPLAPAAGGVNYTSPSDSLVLEDDSGRVVLTSGDAGAEEEEGDEKEKAEKGSSSTVLPVGDFVTGLVVAVLGRPTAAGAFLVEDVCLAGLPPQPAAAPALPTVPAPTDGPRYVLLASGLELSEGSDLLPLQLLVDYVQGHLGALETVSRVGRVVLVGGLLAPFDPAMFKEKHLSAKQQREFSQPFRHLDLLLAQLAAACPLDVMPGADDPANYTLPQQPLHPCLLPHTARYKATFRLVPNPYECWLGGDRLLLGGSGQVPEDMAKYTTPLTAPKDDKGDEGNEAAAASLKLMEATLQWRHLAPTAPDTLPCYPFCDTDPFVLDACPHAYFVGNQDAFATSLVTGPDGQKCRVVCVPAFNKTQEVVLLELNTLEATPLRFSAAALSAASASASAAPAAVPMAVDGGGGSKPEEEEEDGMDEDN